jgi:Flp pilus assembly protein TadG
VLQSSSAFNIVAQAKQSLKDKQTVKEKRVRKTGTVPIQSQGTKNMYSHIKSKIDTHASKDINRVSTRINTSKSARPDIRNDSAISLDNVSDISLDYANTSNSSLRTHQKTTIVHVSRSSKTNSLNQENIAPIVNSKHSKPTIILGNHQSNNQTVMTKMFTKVQKPIVKKVHTPTKETNLLPISLISKPKLFRKPIKHLWKDLPFFEPTLVEEYEQDIFTYWKELEVLKFLLDSIFT